MSAPGSRPVLEGPPPGMGAGDAELLAIARELLARIYVPERHEVVAAMRTASGRVYTGVHVEGSARRSSVCAEGVAMGTTLAGCSEHGEPFEIEAVVSVLRRPTGTEHIIEPCGVCAELITDYAPDARVWVAWGEEHGHIQAVRARDLLPAKRRRIW